MGLIEQEIMEFRQVKKLFKEGKISPENFITEVKAFTAIEKMAALKLKCIVAGEMFSKRCRKDIYESNLCGMGTYIDLGIDFEAEKIMCSANGGITTRLECLEYSGDAEHFSSCSQCDHFGETRRCLLEYKKD